MTGDENWLGATSAALRSLAAKSGHGPAVMILPPHAVLLKHLKTPRVDPTKRDRIVQFEVAQNIPFAINEVVWDTVVAGEREQEVDLLLAAAKLEVVEPLCLAARSAGFDVRQVVPAALALHAAETLLPSVGRERRLVLSMGARAVTFLQSGGSCFALRSLAMNGAESGEDGALRLAQEARRSILHFQRQNGLEAPTVVRLNGDRAQLPNLAADLGGQLNLPVEWLDVVPAIRFAPSVTPAVADAALADLFGAAAIQLQLVMTAMNLLPPAVHRREELRRRRPWLIAAAALAAGSLLPPISHYRRASARAGAEMAAVEKVVAPLQRREASNRSRLNEIAALTRELAQLRVLDERRTGWIRLLADLQEEFTAVEDAWVEGMQPIAPTGDGPMKLSISGRMLDRRNPLAKVSSESEARVKSLLAGIARSPWVATVESERFDSTRPGILKFDFVVVTNSAQPL